MLDKFIKSYPGQYKYTATVSHKGKVVAFAMNDQQRIFYTVLDVNEHETKTGPKQDVDLWQDSPTELIFSNEITDVGFGVTDQIMLPVFKKGSAQPEVNGTILPPGKENEYDYFLSTTARFSADAPFQVLSDGAYVYIFRQAISGDSNKIVYVDQESHILVKKDGNAGYVAFNPTTSKNEWISCNQMKTPLVDGTLLVDRFLLVGNRLTSKMEARYQRSRSKARPASRKDSLDSKDMNGNVFYEPTQELRFITNLTGGHFSVLLLPTQIAEVQRWQIFAENRITSMMDSYNIERSDDGLFNTRGSQVYTCPNPDHLHTEGQVFRRKPGKCDEPLKGGKSCGKEFVPVIGEKKYSESALEFDGKESYISIPNIRNLTLTEALTVEAWIKGNAWNSAGAVVGKGATENGKAAGFALRCQKDGWLDFAVAVDGQWATVKSESAIASNTWVHVAGTYDGKSVRVYINGEEKGKQDKAGKLSKSSSGLNIGRSPGSPSRIFAGAIDDVRIWDRAHGETEIKRDMYQRLTGLEPDLAGYWRLDEASGEDIYDQTNNKWNGKIIKGATWKISDAPVGEHPGIERTSFFIAGRSFQSGPAALLFYQQSSDESGYLQEKKPMKRSARVLLAVATQDGSAANQNYIAALDFGVSVSGRLAQVPDKLNLELLAGEASSTDLKLDQVISLEKELQDKQRAVNLALEQKNMTKEEKEDKAVQALLTRFKELNSNFLGKYGVGIREAEVKKKQQDIRGYGPSKVNLYPPMIEASAWMSIVNLNSGMSGNIPWGELLSDMERATDLSIFSFAMPSSDKLISVHQLKFQSSSKKDEEQYKQADTALKEHLIKIQTIKSSLTDGISVSMPKVHTDPFKLTIAGGLLGFAWSNDRPLLFDSATGALGLYFRGRDDQFFVAYYDTLVEDIKSATCKWTAAAPGMTLSFNGKDTYAIPKASGELSPFDATGDMAMEAWIRPSHVNGMARVIQHLSERSAYVLRLQQAEAKSALMFDGNKDYISIPNTQNLAITNAITVEAWIKASAWKTNSSDGVIVGKQSDENGKPAGFALRCGKNGMLDFVVAVDRQWAEVQSEPVMKRDTWVHVAGTYDGKSVRVYINGEEKGKQDKAGKLSKSSSDLNIGCAADAKSGWFAGTLDEVRIWKRARTAQEIQADMNHPLSGNETDLAAYWRFENRKANNYTTNKSIGTFHGNPAQVASPLPAYSIIAGIDEFYVQSKAVFPCGQWTHLAAVNKRAYGLKFHSAGDYLDCGNNKSLDINTDLTLEVFFQIDSANSDYELLSRGQLRGGQNVPYCLAIKSGKVVFSFEDVDGNLKEFRSMKTNLEVGKTYHVMVARKSRQISWTDFVKNQGAGKSINFTWSDIDIYVNSNVPENFKYVYKDKEDVRKAINDLLADTQSDTQMDSLHKIYRHENLKPGDIGSNDQALKIGSSFSGILMDVRIWNVSRGTEDFEKEISGKEKGLISWWRFKEREGDKTNDDISQNHATLKGIVKWVISPDSSIGSNLQIYVNGVPQESILNRSQVSAKPERGFTLGALLVGKNQRQELFMGELDEVRLWNTLRTEEQIQDNLFRCLLGEKQDLIANYNFDLEKAGEISDFSLRGNHLSIQGVARYVISTAPIGEDTPQVRSALAGIHTPFSGKISSTPAVQEYGDMQLDSQGNLIGILKRCYSYILEENWRIITGFKVGDMVTEWVGQVQFAPQLMGYIEGAPPVPSENLIKTEEDGNWVDFNEASKVEMVQAEDTTYTYSASRETGWDMDIGFKLGLLLGADAAAGIGLITKVTELENIIGLQGRFEHSEGWLQDASTGVGRTIKRATSMGLRGDFVDTPVDGEQRFVPDNVGLALVQSTTADVFALRLKHNGALIAYQMRPNPKIPKDWNIITFKVNPRYIKQGTLDGRIGEDCDPDYPNADELSFNSSYYKPIEAYDWKKKLDQDTAELATTYDQYEAEAKGRRVKDDMFVGQVLDKLPQLHKRNLVNTYVWTADGGLFAETEETMDVQQETTGGSYSFKGMGGLYANLSFYVSGFGLKTEIDALFGGHMELSVKKDKESRNSFQVEVELNKVELRERKPGKVDAYRFMTFYLEPDSDHFDDFFKTVVDPKWLAESNEANADALRKARQDDKKPACWRIMHRVTFISRILGDVSSGPQSALEQTLPALDIDSNYELIKMLDPYVRDHLTNGFLEFSNAVRDALEKKFPDTRLNNPKVKAEIIKYLGLYYGLPEQSA